MSCRLAYRQKPCLHLLKPSYASVIARCLTKRFATSPLCSIPWTPEWQSRNVLLTFRLYVPSPVLLNGNKMSTHLLHKANGYYMLSLSRRKPVFVITGASPASQEVLTSHPHLNQHSEICQSLGFYPSHPKSLNEAQTWSALLKGQDLAAAQRYTQ